MFSGGIKKARIEGLLLWVLILLVSCVDYVMISSEFSAVAPKIAEEFLSPHPLKSVMPIPMGQNCRGQEFKVPPITHPDENKKLYYLWFFDQKLVSPQSVIDSSFRNKSVVMFTINKDFLFSFYGAKLPKDFFSRLHTLEFVVSEKAYEIPESRLLEGYEQDAKKHQDSVYWIVKFTNDSC